MAQDAARQGTLPNIKSTISPICFSEVLTPVIFTVIDYAPRIVSIRTLKYIEEEEISRLLAYKHLRGKRQSAP